MDIGPNHIKPFELHIFTTAQFTHRLESLCIVLMKPCKYVKCEKLYQNLCDQGCYGTAHI